MKATFSISNLQKWDGKHTEPLQRMYKNNIGSGDFIDSLLQLYRENAKLRHATSWLLKYHLDQGGIFTTTQVSQLLFEPAEQDHWEVKLHILQMIPRLGLNKKQASKIEKFAMTAMQSDKKFTRAAAYEAAYCIVKLLPEKADSFFEACKKALESESASVKVKIRRILAGG